MIITNVENEAIYEEINAESSFHSDKAMNDGYVIVT